MVLRLDAPEGSLGHKKAANHVTTVAPFAALEPGATHL
jgi:hypothetical protein